MADGVLAPNDVADGADADTVRASLLPGNAAPALAAASPAAEAAAIDPAVWKILVVDDEPAIHQVTKLALRNLSVLGRPSQLINALSAQDARAQLAQHPDIAVVLLDVVMETEDAGLEFIKHIRKEADNALVRIILRTGQPGQAPERQVMVDYDINDYKEKTELTASKLYTSVMSSIRTFGHLQAIAGSQRAVNVLGRMGTGLFAAADLAALPQVLVAQLEGLGLFNSVACWPEVAEPLVAPPVAITPPLPTLSQRARLAPGTLVAQDNRYAAALVVAGGQTLCLHMLAPQPLDAPSVHVLQLWVQSASTVLERWNASH